MYICTSPQTDNHASTPPLTFLQAGYSSCHPTNSVKALKENTNDWTHWNNCLIKVVSKNVIYQIT